MAIYRGPGGSGDATTDASSQATVATEKAAEAAASAVAAANSATLAEASYDSFDDRYLGPKSSAPSVDNDGNSLLTGALYWNSSTNDLYVWNGSAWEQAAFTLTSSDIITALGYTPVPNTRTLTINGTAYDLSTNRTWTITGDSLLPSQSGNSGKVLTTNGTTTSWATDATGVASFNSRTGAVTLSSADVITALATGSIATVKLADSSVTTAKIADANVTTAKISDSNVTTAKISDNNVTTAKIAADAITNAKIADDAVDTENIADDAITSALIDDNAVVTAGIADDAVTEAKLANAINTAIAANTAKTGITTSQASAITANTAKTGITTGQADAIVANTAKVTNATHTGDVTGATSLTIASNAVTTAKILDANVTDAKINTMSSSKLTGALPAIDGSALTNMTSTGEILQVVTVQPDTGLVSFTSTSFAEVDADLRVTITPKATDSTLIVTCNYLFGGNNGSQMCQMKLYDITNGTNVNTSASGSRIQCNSSVRDMSYDVNDGVQMQLQAQTTSGSTVARTYGMYAKLEAAATRYFFANFSNTGALGYAKPSITVMEVAA